MHDWLRFQFIYECAEAIERHAYLIGDASMTANEQAARAHFECIRLVAQQLEKTLKEIEKQQPKPAKAKEAA